ncbi:MAG: hypothetical protein JSR66_04655 [Proteobacteria bacterium]|nr:hypothetical protein [Pseudomonadota bacterium]
MADSEITALRAQICKLESELVALRVDTMRTYVPWSFCRCIANRCLLGMIALDILTLAHGFKWI